MLMDAGTILRLGSAMLALGSVGLFLVHATNHRLRGLSWLGASFATGFFGALLLTLPLPPIAVLFGSDLAVLLSFVLLHIAVMDLMGQRHLLDASSLALLAVLGVVDSLHLNGYVSMSVRIEAISLLVALQCALSSRLLLRLARKGERGPAVFSATVLGSFAAFNVLRAVIVAVGWADRAHWHGVVYAGAYALYIAIALGLAFGFFWMSTAQLSVQLERLAGTDPLTRVYNRRTFLRACDLELTLSSRKKRSFSILMIDLDHFKSINDRYGHSVGDAALVAAVQSMQDSIRGSDVLARWGGEEFAALLPNANLEAAHVVAERLRANVERVEMPVSSLTSEDRVVRMTASVGLATYEPGESIQQLMNRADHNLYLAKSSGRNRVLSEMEPALSN